MRIKKLFRKMLAAAVTTGIFVIMPLVSAEVREYEGFGEYVMSDFETPDIAKQRAKARAEQNAMEQAGVYVESYTKVINAKVTHDEITTMTNGILKVKDTQYKMMPTEDGKAFFIHATVKVDINTDDVLNWISQNKQKMDMLVEQNKALQKAKEEQDQQIEKLKKQVVNVKSEHDREKMQAEFTASDQEFLSNQKMDEGFRLLNNGDYIEAVILFSQAVEINPQNARAYSLLGGSYAELKDEQKALANCDKAIALAPHDPRVYGNRGVVYSIWGNHAKAIVDFTKAIELSSNNALAYHHRGIEYAELGDFTKALEDFGKAIKYAPQDAMAYSNRGLAYGKLGNYNQALSDLMRAIEIDSDQAFAYNIRGRIYVMLKDYISAISDFTKAIELNSKDAGGYYARGVAYQCIGDTVKANEDFAIANSLGYKP